MLKDDKRRVKELNQCGLLATLSHYQWCLLFLHCIVDAWTASQDQRQCGAWHQGQAATGLWGVTSQQSWLEVSMERRVDLECFADPAECTCMHCVLEFRWVVICQGKVRCPVLQVVVLSLLQRLRLVVVAVQGLVATLAETRYGEGLWTARSLASWLRSFSWSSLRVGGVSRWLAYESVRFEKEEAREERRRSEGVMSWQLLLW